MESQDHVETSRGEAGRGGLVKRERSHLLIRTVSTPVEIRASPFETETLDVECHSHVLWERFVCVRMFACVCMRVFVCVCVDARVCVRVCVRARR